MVIDTERRSRKQRNRLTASVFAVVFALAGLAGCAGPTLRINSRAHLVDAAPVERLLVLSNVLGPAFNSEVYVGFEEAAASLLGQCGVEAKFFLRDPMGLDERARIEAARAELEPDSVLFFQNIGGGVISAKGGFQHFELKLFDVKSEKLFWQARLSFSYTSNKESGKTLATEIITRIRDDGVLKGCPAGKLAVPSVPYVGPYTKCRRKRREVLREANQIEDQRRRTEVINSAPTCR